MCTNSNTQRSTMCKTRGGSNNSSRHEVDISKTARRCTIQRAEALKRPQHGTTQHTSARMSSSEVVSGKPLMYTEFSATGGTRRPRPSPPSSPFSPPYSPPSPPPARRPRLRLRPPPPPPLASPFSLRSRVGRTRATDVLSSSSSCWFGWGVGVAWWGKGGLGWVRRRGRKQ